MTLLSANLDLRTMQLGDINPGQPDDRVREALDDEYRRWLPPCERRRPAPACRAPTPASDRPRVKRRAQYARVQRLYNKNRTRCAQDVISGAWQDPPATLPLEEQEPFWRSLFEHPSVPDDRTPDPVGPPKWELLAPITSEEVAKSLGGMKDGAPGPDGRKLKDVKAIPFDQLAGHFNLWLYAGTLPSPLRDAETVLLPKESGASAPEKYRPITISDIVVRCFHRILAQRMEVHLPFSSRQKAFRAGDGIADSVWFLQTVIKHHQDNLCPLSVAFVDVRKAFDSVSHRSILVAAARLGVPSPFLVYLRELYSDARTRLRIGTELSDPIRLGRGVRQGDPMSVHLFNAVIDLSLADLGPGLGTSVGGVRVNHGAFADDIALIACRHDSLQVLADDLDHRLRLCGLEISTGLGGKSASFRICIDGRAKKWTVFPHPFLRIGGQLIPTLTASQVYKYLGVKISPQRTKANVGEMLQEGLNNISAAPLKPQQRLYIASCHLIPKLQHQLTLTSPSAKYLNWLDRTVRAAVRSWLKLPKDTPTAYFHAKAVDGGLNIITLEHAIPLARQSRIARMAESQDPVMSAILQTPAALGLLKHRQTTLDGSVVATRRGLRGLLANQLHRSVDGRGLAPASRVPKQHQWVTAGTTISSGGAFVGAIKIRGGLVATALRTSRGFPNQSKSCDCCGRTESLGHILQVCPRTHASRIARHNKIVDLVEGGAVRLGYGVKRELAIPTPAGIRRPDLVLDRGGKVTILDVTIVADNADLDECHNNKCLYYDQPAIRQWAQRCYEPRSISFEALAMSWRGLMAKRSAASLRDLGLSASFLSLVNFVTLERGMWIVNHFRRSTFRVRAP